MASQWENVCAGVKSSYTKQCCGLYIGPKGKTGASGPTGPTGPTGPQGPVGGTPAGNDMNVQFNNAGFFGGSDDFNWNDTTKIATIVGSGVNFTGATSGNALNLAPDPSTAAYPLILPPAQGLANTVLENDGAGVLSWGNKSEELPGGVDGNVQFNDGGVFGADAEFSWDKVTNTLTVDTTATGTTVAAGAVVGGLNLIGGSIGIGGGGGKLELIGSTSGDAVSLAANVNSTTYPLVLPSAQGGATTTLQNDGAGNLVWAGIPAPTLVWQWIIHSNSNVGADQGFSYCHANVPSPGGINNFLTWTTDPTAIIDNTYFTFSGNNMTCTLDVPSQLLLRLQVFITFGINPGSGPQVRLIPRLNGQPFGLDGLLWSGNAAGSFNCLKINETLPEIKAGDVITINMTNSTAQIPSYNVNYKAWLQP